MYFILEFISKFGFCKIWQVPVLKSANESFEIATLKVLFQRVQYHNTSLNISTINRALLWCLTTRVVTEAKALVSHGDQLVDEACA